MSELNFPTKLIRLTKATLSIVTCCVKIQNDCSEPFETRQGLRQGDVLSTLHFNGTQLLAYADDIVIVGRSQSGIWDAYLALERETAKVGLKIND
jgi:hypothetical protein